MRVTGVDGGWLYAVGDVTKRALLTHMGKYQGRVAGDVIAARAAGRPDDGPGMRAWADHDAVSRRWCSPTRRLVPSARRPGTHRTPASWTPTWVR